MKPITTFIAKLDDWCNPIAVKELRQAVQSKFVSGLLILFLVGQLVTMSAVVLARNEYESAFDTGRNAFMILFGILIGACMLFLPAYAAGRLIAERSSTNGDLILTTALRPRAIIWGKVASGLVLTMLAYSACMPFLTFTYLLRGVDLLSIFIVLAAGFIGNAVAVQLALFLACLPGPRQIRPIYALIGLGGSVVAFVCTLAFSAVVVGTGYEHFETKEALLFLALIAALGLLAFGFLLVLSVAILSPRSANRALPVRVYITGVWLIAWAAVAVWSLETQSTDPVRPWMIASLSVFSLALLIAVGERDALGFRVARTIPRRRLVRGVAFLFYSGAAGGVAWACLMQGLTALVAAGWHWSFPSFAANSFYGDMPDLVVSMLGGSLYVFCYCMTGAVLARTFFRSMGPSYSWAIATLVAGIAFALPVVGYILQAEVRRHGPGVWCLANPIILTGEFLEYRSLGLSFVAVWAGAAIVLNASWFRERLKAFRPPKATGGVR